MFVILDYLQVEIKSKKMPAPLKESMTKRLNENEFIENNENAVDDPATMGNFIRKCKKKPFFEL